MHFILNSRLEFKYLKNEKLISLIKSENRKLQ